MKKFTLLASALALGATLNASPLMTIGDEVDVFLLGSVKGSWNSNIYSSDKKVDDYILTLKAGAEAAYGRNSNFKANVKFYELFQRYLGNAVNNTQLANVFANVSYTEERWNVAANFSYQQFSSSSDDLIASGLSGELTEGLVNYDKINAGIKGAYNFTDKLSANLGFNWERVTYGNYTNQYSDRDVYSLPVSLFYSVTEKIQAGLTYQYRYTEYEGGSVSSALNYGNETTDHYAGVTVRGEIAPKLSTEIFLGYTHRDMGGVVTGGSDSDSTFAFSARFDYLATEKLRTYVKASRDMGNGASRQTSVNTGVEIGANYAFSDKISSFASARYFYSDYKNQNRNDDNYMLSLGTTWKPIQNTYVTAAYRYLDNSSNNQNSSYMGHLISIEAGFKY